MFGRLAFTVVDTSVLHRNVLECVVHVRMDLKGCSFLSQTDIFYGFGEVVMFPKNSCFFFSLTARKQLQSSVILPDLIVRAH